MTAELLKNLNAQICFYQKLDFPYTHLNNFNGNTDETKNCNDGEIMTLFWNARFSIYYVSFLVFHVSLRKPIILPLRFNQYLIPALEAMYKHSESNLTSNRSNISSNSRSNLRMEIGNCKLI